MKPPSKFAKRWPNVSMSSSREERKSVLMRSIADSNRDSRTVSIIF